MKTEVKRGRPVVKGSARQMKLKERSKKLAKLGLELDAKLPQGRKPTEKVEKRRNWVAKQMAKENFEDLQAELVKTYVEKFGAHKEQFYMDKRAITSKAA